MAEVIQVENLKKTYGSITAVDRISFEVREGEIMGLLGPNGAGKTTTISMLLGLTKPEGGEIRIFGLDLEKRRQQILKRVGYADAELRMQGRLTVYENLLVYTYLFEIKDKKECIERLLGQLEITNLKNRRFEDLSSGQKSRVILCKALLNKPELLLLDEPTTGLDPEISERVQDYLLRLRGAGKATMLYTSHNMGEVTRLCDRIIFINQGRIVAEDTPLNLTRKLRDTILHLTFASPLTKIKKFCQQKGLSCQIPEPHHVLVRIDERDIATTLSNLATVGIEITDIEIERPDLKDVFIKLAQKGKDVSSTR
jgi:ABC-2 type transport system ATP-binding protein